MVYNDVFISFSNKDFDIARYIQDNLIVQGISCRRVSWDSHLYKDELEVQCDAIRNCQIFVLILSEAASISHDVRRELSYAGYLNKHIIAYRIEDVSINQLDFFGNQIHFIDSYQDPMNMVEPLLLDINSRLKYGSVNNQQSRAHISYETPSPTHYDRVATRPIAQEEANRRHNTPRLSSAFSIKESFAPNKKAKVKPEGSLLGSIGARITGSITSTLFAFATVPNKGAKKLADVCSAIYAPAEINSGDCMIVQVYLYLNEESGDVELKAKTIDQEAVVRNYTPLSIKLKEGDRVDIALDFYSEAIDKQQPKSLVWQGKMTSSEFAVFVPTHINIQNLLGKVLIIVNKLPVGDMIFKTKIVQHSPSTLYSKVDSHFYKKIFISYAHQDSSNVEFMAKMCEAQGIDYFFDRHYLKGGDVYDEKIIKYIDSSDLFILCWSENAAKSEYIAKEKAQALLRAYPQKSKEEATIKIYPISIAPYAPLPKDITDVYNFEVI